MGQEPTPTPTPAPPAPEPTPAPPTDPPPTPTPEPPPAPPEPAPAPPPAPPSGQEPDTFPRAHVEELRRESAGYRTRAQEAEKRADTAELQLRQIQAARAAGIPLDLAENLRGTTDEELLADAQRMAGFVSTPTPTPSPSTGLPAPPPGPAPTPTPTLAEQIAEAERKGDAGLARRLKAQQLVERATTTP